MEFGGITGGLRLLLKMVNGLGGYFLQVFDRNSLWIARIFPLSK